MSVILDTREFDRALVQYAAASKKNFADIANRQTMNLAIQGLKLTKKAETVAVPIVVFAQPIQMEFVRLKLIYSRLVLSHGA